MLWTNKVWWALLQLLRSGVVYLYLCCVFVCSLPFIHLGGSCPLDQGHGQSVGTMENWNWKLWKLFIHSVLFRAKLLLYLSANLVKFILLSILWLNVNQTCTIPGRKLQHLVQETNTVWTMLDFCTSQGIYCKGFKLSNILDYDLTAQTCENVDYLRTFA